MNCVCQGEGLGLEKIIGFSVSLFEHRGGWGRGRSESGADASHSFIFPQLGGL